MRRLILTLCEWIYTRVVTKEIPAGDILQYGIKSTHMEYDSG